MLTFLFPCFWNILKEQQSCFLRGTTTESRAVFKSIETFSERDGKLPLNGNKKREQGSAATAKVSTVNKEAGQHSARIIICSPAPIIITTANPASIHAALRLITHERLLCVRRKEEKKKKNVLRGRFPPDASSASRRRFKGVSLTKNNIC